MIYVHGIVTAVAKATKSVLLVNTIANFILPARVRVMCGGWTENASLYIVKKNICIRL